MQTEEQKIPYYVGEGHTKPFPNLWEKMDGETLCSSVKYSGQVLNPNIFRISI